MKNDEWGNRLIWMIPMIVIIVLLLSFGLYQWIIPRTDLEVRTVYHEAPGGGGTGGTININILLSNLGNREIDSLESSVSVQLKEGGNVARHESGPENLPPGDNVEIKITYIGSHYDTYLISVDLRFDCSGDTHTGSMQYETEEDHMNMVFIHNMR
ncbi:MAG: hypothetical protein ACMUHY_08965 [Thermoplasmatota archaeon]